MTLARVADKGRTGGADVDVYDQIAAMKPFVLERRWDALESAYRATCADLAGPRQAERISTLDFTSYQHRLASGLAEAARRFEGSAAVALFFEYDLDDDWEGAFFLCQDYAPEADGDEDWACAWVDRLAAPGFPEASALYRENHFDRTPVALGSTLYLVARTVAAFGRCVDTARLDARAVCIGFHDQTPLMRIQGT